MSTAPLSGRLAPPPSAGPPVEQQIAFDMIRRALPGLPVLVILAGLIWGMDGALSAAFAIALVVVNFLVAASLMVWAAGKALALLAIAAVGGFVLRLALITIAVLAIKDQSWVELVPLGLTLVITHLGLLIWETRHVSLSLAFPALKPPSRAE